MERLDDKYQADTTWAVQIEDGCHSFKGSMINNSNFTKDNWQLQLGQLENLKANQRQWA